MAAHLNQRFPDHVWVPGDGSGALVPRDTLSHYGSRDATILPYDRIGNMDGTSAVASRLTIVGVPREEWSGSVGRVHSGTSSGLEHIARTQPDTKDNELVGCLALLGVCSLPVIVPVAYVFYTYFTN